ncbi:hypothetical protein QUC31_000140 [Theobroma cacao]
MCLSSYVYSHLEVKVLSEPKDGKAKKKSRAETKVAAATDTTTDDDSFDRNLTFDTQDLKLISILFSKGRLKKTCSDICRKISVPEYSGRIVMKCAAPLLLDNRVIKSYITMN